MAHSGFAEPDEQQEHHFQNWVVAAFHYIFIGGLFVSIFYSIIGSIIGFIIGGGWLRVGYNRNKN